MPIENTRSSPIARSNRGRMLLILVLAACVVLPLSAAEIAFTFEPLQSQVHWTLDTALHTVHGTFQLKGGKIVFDPATGKAGGALIVDAMSGESGNESRDKRMHASIIESRKYTEIVFTPDRVEGSLPAEGSAMVQVHGKFRLMNVDHDLTLPVTIEVHPDQVVASAKFTVPYIQWGLKNPSVMFLRVSDHVDIEIHSVGRAATALQAAK
jgi:polyisoprenoid-binding protein YceI